MESASMVTLEVDGQAHTVASGQSLAAALHNLGLNSTRSSVTGQPRAPFCGMGICQECRVEVNGLRRLACQTTVADGMRVKCLLARGSEP